MMRSSSHPSARIHDTVLYRDAAQAVHLALENDDLHMGSVREDLAQSPRHRELEVLVVPVARSVDEQDGNVLLGKTARSIEEPLTHPRVGEA